ncbi:AAA family ATPase [Chloroflexota bacterium]
MIPVKLKLHNFMCYRDNVPPLNFTGIHTACLSGENGNGKSALIDAMTWALWGQARAKSDDDLVHSGRNTMEVEFDFAVNRQLYRIIRKRSRPKRQSSSGQSILEFQVATEEGFKSITGNSLTQTQQKITATLHMDYPTFINSAFLRQGHADEFTVKRPAERKEVLGEILGLSLYDELEEQAKKLASQQGTEKAQLEIAIAEIGDELAQKPAYQRELEQAQSELTNIEKVLRDRETGLNELKQQRETLEKKKVQLEQLEVNLGDKKRSLEREDEQLRQYRSRLKEYETLIGQRAAIEEGYTRFSLTKTRHDELSQKSALLHKLNERKNQLEKAFNSALESIKTEHTLAQKNISDLEAKSQELIPLKNQIQSLQGQLARLAEREDILRNKKKSCQELQNQANQLESRKAQLEKEISETGEKLDLLSTRTEAKCPLCERELEPGGLKLIQSKYTAERESKTDALKSTRDEISRRKLELATLESEISQLEPQLTQEKVSIQSNIGILRNKATESEGAEKQLAEEKTRLSEIELRWTKKDFAAVEQEALAELEGELAKLGYDAEQHEQAQQQLRNLEHYEDSKRNLEEADRFITREKEAVSRAEANLQELQCSLEAGNQEKEALTAELGALPRLVSEINQADAERQALSGQQKQAQEILWSVNARLQRCAELETKKKDKEGLLTQTSKQESIYKELAKAFGKGGVQALLIEMALPEIEAEANRLLGRMTDNRMHAKFETQRESKKGDIIETLDINISDELGTRNYEMFSGGEAFRINFAIRIALSKLLARRSGAPLPTLIIDEGFGTQDSTGIEKLKEAINSIQDDFEKIFVITHIEELRDAFPTRIDVTKSDEGSNVSIS